MADNKKYYYLKLKDNFFDSEEIKILESMDNGYKYSNILLKMYLKSLKRDGLFIFKDKIPYNPKMIATVTNHNINDVKQALILFDEMGLIEKLSDGAIYMMDIQNFIGKSTSEADRIRSYRNKIEQKKTELLNDKKTDKLGICTNVQQKNDISTPELELELELEKEKELEKVNVDINSKLDVINDNISTQRKEEKSKEEEKKKNNETYREFKHLKMTISEYDRLISEGYPKYQIDNILDKIENYAKNTKYSSLNLTARNWLKREYKLPTAKDEIPIDMQDFIPEGA